MSVLKRFRGESKFQIMTDARTIRGLAIEWSMNEKHVPKRKRILFLEDLKTATTSLVNNIRIAEKSFPCNQENLDIRKKHLRLAIDDIERIWDIFEFMDDVAEQSNPIDWDSAYPCLEILDKEYSAVKKMLDTCTIIPNKFC